ncbi:MAG: hypothetical protein Kow0088_04320 [Anaerolineales bacterium]
MGWNGCLWRIGGGGQTQAWAQWGLPLALDERVSEAQPNQQEREEEKKDNFLVQGIPFSKRGRYEYNTE